MNNNTMNNNMNNNMNKLYKCFTSDISKETLKILNNTGYTWDKFCYNHLELPALFIREFSSHDLIKFTIDKGNITMISGSAWTPYSNALMNSIVANDTVPVDGEDVINLIKACKEGNIEKVTQLLDYTHVHPVKDDNHVILAAIENGCAQIVSKLLQWRGPNGEFVDPREYGYICCEKGSIDILTILLDWQGPNGERIDVHFDDYGNQTIFMNAIVNNHIDIVDMLLNWKDVNGDFIDPTENDNNAIFEAIITKNIDMVRLLLKWRGPSGQYIDISVCNDDLQRPIDVAMEHGHTEIINMLELHQ